MSEDTQHEAGQTPLLSSEPPDHATVAERYRFFLEATVPTPEKPFWGFGLAGNLPDKLIPIIKKLFGDVFPQNESIVAALGSRKAAILCTDRALYWGGQKVPVRRVEYDQILSANCHLPSNFLTDNTQFSVNGHRLEIEDVFLSLPTAAFVSCLQRAMGQTPATKLEEIRSKFEEVLSPKGKRKATAISVGLLALAICTIILPFINPRVLAPVVLGFAALSHSASRRWSPLTVIGDIFVWVVLTYMMFSWIMKGF